MFYGTYFSTCVTVFRGAFLYSCLFDSGSLTQSSLTQLIQTVIPNMCNSAQSVVDSGIFSIKCKLLIMVKTFNVHNVDLFRKQIKTDVFQHDSDAVFI